MQREVEKSGDEVRSTIKVAVVQGKSVTELPKGVYIPSSPLTVSTSDFEGPLDLLLYFIKKDDLKISELEVAPITEQYLNYISMMEELNVDLAGEYLVMAAYLTEVKSKMLLPMPKFDEEDDLDPRSVLIARLKVYEQFKKASLELDKLPRMEREWFETVVSAEKTQSLAPPTAKILDITDALRGVLSRLVLSAAHLIGKERLSVKDRMQKIMSLLRFGDLVSFAKLSSKDEGRAGIVVSLIAILELAKGQILEIIQNKSGEGVYIRKATQKRAEKNA